MKADEQLLDMFLEHCEAQEFQNAGWCGTGVRERCHSHIAWIKKDWANGDRERAVANTAQWLFDLGDPYGRECRVWHEEELPSDWGPWLGTAVRDDDGELCDPLIWLTRNRD